MEEIFRLLQCAQGNFDNLVGYNEILGKHPMYKVARRQLDDAVAALEQKLAYVREQLEKVPHGTNANDKIHFKNASTPVTREQVNHPSHYNNGKIEVIDVIEDQIMNFHLGNAFKYVSRAGKKDPDKYIEDLEKALWYLERRKGYGSGLNRITPMMFVEDQTFTGPQAMVIMAIMNANDSNENFDITKAIEITKEFINTEKVKRG